MVDMEITEVARALAHAGACCYSSRAHVSVSLRGPSDLLLPPSCPSEPVPSPPTVFGGYRYSQGRCAQTGKALRTAKREAASLVDAQTAGVDG
jgi:hypothetical protein